MLHEKYVCCLWTLFSLDILTKCGMLDPKIKQDVISLTSLNEQQGGNAGNYNNKCKIKGIILYFSYSPQLLAFLICLFVCSIKPNHGSIEEKADLGIRRSRMNVESLRELICLVFYSVYFFLKLNLD